MLAIINTIMRELKRLLMLYILAPKSQRYYWTKEWQEGEREADEDIALGRYDKCSSTGDAIVYSSSSNDYCIRSGSTTNP